MTAGPWDHRMKTVGLYELRFNGQAQAEVMWTKTPTMAAVLVREIVTGLNDGYASRHPIDTAPAADTDAPAAPPPPATPTPAQWGEPIHTPEAVAEWAKVHAVDRRTYWNGAGLAHQAYLDEVTGRPDVDESTAA